MKKQKNNTPKESTDWNDFWKNLKERSNGKIQKPILVQIDINLKFYVVNKN